MAEIITPRYDYIPQAEAYPPEEWTWRGIIYPGVFEGTTSFIQYKFDSIKRDLATGATYYTNYGTDGLHYNTPAQASNHVWLNGTDQSVDLPTVASGYVTYFDVDTKVFVTTAITDGNPLTMTDSFSSYFTTDVPVTEGDRSYLNTNPEALYTMWFGEPVVGLSFTKANMINFVPSTEGLQNAGQGGKHIQDLSYDYGVDMLDNNAPTYTASDEVATFTSNTDNDFTLNVTTVGTSNLHPRIRTYTVNPTVAGQAYIVEFDAVVSGYCEIQVYLNNELTYVKHVVYNGRNAFLFSPTSASTNARMYFDGTFLFDVEITNYTLREATAYEIVNYTNDCRDTLANTSYGASNFALVQDASGRVTGMGLVNTQNFPPYDDGRYASTGFKPSIPTYSIEETVTGELQDFGTNTYNDSISGQSEVVVTESPVGTFEVTYVATANGTIISLDSTYPDGTLVKIDMTCELVSGAIQFTRAYDGSTYADLAGGDGTIKTGIVTMLAYSYNGSASVLLRPSNFSDAVFKITGVLVQELTTKTQRTEQRLLTHTDNHLGTQLVPNTEFNDLTDVNSAGSPSLSVSNNRLRVEVTAANIGPYAREYVATEIGKLYIFTGTLYKGTSTIAEYRITTPAGTTLGTVYNSTTTKVDASFYFIATTIETHMRMYGRDTAGLYSEYENPSIKEVSTENKYYIDGVEQAVAPALPDPLVDIDLNNTAITGYPDTIDSRLGNFEIHNEVLTP